MSAEWACLFPIYLSISSFCCFIMEILWSAGEKKKTECLPEESEHHGTIEHLTAKTPKTAMCLEDAWTLIEAWSFNFCSTNQRHNSTIQSLMCVQRCQLLASRAMMSGVSGTCPNAHQNLIRNPFLAWTLSQTSTLSVCLWTNLHRGHDSWTDFDWFIKSVHKCEPFFHLRTFSKKFNKLSPKTSVATSRTLLFVVSFLTNGFTVVVPFCGQIFS